MAALEAEVRAIQKDGLLWGTSKLAPVGFGIKKLQITCVIEDAKVRSSLRTADCMALRRLLSSRCSASYTAIKGRCMARPCICCYSVPTHLIVVLFRCHMQVESMDAIIEEELVRDGESDNIQSIDVVAFNKL